MDLSSIRLRDFGTARRRGGRQPLEKLWEFPQQPVGRRRSNNNERSSLQVARTGLRSRPWALERLPGQLLERGRVQSVRWGLAREGLPYGNGPGRLFSGFLGDQSHSQMRGAWPALAEDSADPDTTARLSDRSRFRGSGTDAASAGEGAGRGDDGGP